jgi:hypothetical protein
VNCSCSITSDLFSYLECKISYSIWYIDCTHLFELIRRLKNNLIFIVRCSIIFSIVIMLVLWGNRGWNTLFISLGNLSIKCSYLFFFSLSKSIVFILLFYLYTNIMSVSLQVRECEISMSVWYECIGLVIMTKSIRLNDHKADSRCKIKTCFFINPSSHGDGTSLGLVHHCK